MRLIVFSICKNEAPTIGKVLSRIPANIPGITKIDKLVISDGSTDGTADIARRHGAYVINGRQQKRLAYRFQQAVETVLEMGADIAVGIDGDLQFDPKDIPLLVEPIVKEGYDFVHADRFTDVTCGFRAYGRNALLAVNISSGYTYTQESFQVLALKKLDIKGIPIKVTYYKDRQSRVVESFSKFLVGSAINILRAYRDFAPLRFFGWLGFGVFLLGILALAWLGIHWIQTGTLTPYKFLGFTGIYFVTLGLLFWSLGLVADMFSRSLNNQEKILDNLKKQRFGSGKKAGKK